MYRIFVTSERGKAYWNTPNLALGSIGVATIYPTLEDAQKALPQLKHIHKMSYSKHKYGEIEIEKL